MASQKNELSFLSCAVSFICGASFEFGCAFWVHYTEQKSYAPAVVWSMVNAIFSVCGIETFLKNRLYALFYVLGFGFGTGLAIFLRNCLFL